MFNVTKSLKKLIECSIGDGKKHCNGYVTFAELNAIFEAGQEDEPSKSTELNKACEEFYKGDGWKPLQSKAEGKTPDYLMGIEGKTPDYLTGEKPEKPSECGHEHRFFKQEGTNYYQCHCGKTRPCRHEDLEDTIRISRKVAEEFIKWCEDYCLQETPKSMAIVIRKALEG